MNISLLKKNCKKYIKIFEQRVLPMEYIRQGILLWEGFFFCMLCEINNVDVIVESGLAGGRSTEIFAKYFFNLDVYGCENNRLYGIDRFNETSNRLSKYQNIKIVNADAKVYIPELVSELSKRDKRIALFLDGPKGQEGLELTQKVYDIQGIILIGIHDMCKQNNYHYMDRWNKTTIYSDLDWFLEQYKYLENGNIDNEFLQKELILYPTGYGIGFAIKNGNKERKKLQ